MTVNGSNRTPFYPKREKAIRRAFERMNRDMITPWIFIALPQGRRIENCLGQIVSFSNDDFSGSSRHLFWNGFFEPCIENVIEMYVENTLEDCQKHPNYSEVALMETSDLLQKFVRKVYRRMADIDQANRGNGYPYSVKQEPVHGKIAVMNTVIDEHIDAGRRLLGYGESPEETLNENHEENVFLNGGDFCTISYAGRESSRLKNSIGLKYIHFLLQNPGKEVNALELIGLINLTSPNPSKDILNKMTSSELENENLFSTSLGHAGEAIDEKTLKEIGMNIQEICGELDEAEKNNDTGGVEILLEKKHKLEKYLSNSMGLGGRSRKLDDSADKARQAVSVAIHRAIKKLESECPLLFEHLNQYLQIGHRSCYGPDPEVCWKT